MCVQICRQRISRREGFPQVLRGKCFDIEAVGSNNDDDSEKERETSDARKLSEV